VKRSDDAALLHPNKQPTEEQPTKQTVSFDEAKNDNTNSTSTDAVDNKPADDIERTHDVAEVDCADEFEGVNDERDRIDDDLGNDVNPNDIDDRMMECDNNATPPIK
jgi:hypothetical protein